MPITVRCSCGKLLQAGDDWGGRQAKCPHCSRAVTIPAPKAAAASGASGLSDLLDEELARAATASSSDAVAAPEKTRLRIDVRCVAEVPPEREVVAAIDSGVREHIERFGEGGFRDVDVQIEVVEWKWGSMHTAVGLSLTGWVNGKPVKKRFWAGHSNWYMWGLLGLLIASVEKSLRSGRRVSKQQRRYLDKCLLDLYVALDRASGRPRPKGTRLWTAITGVGATIALAAMVLTIFVAGNQGRCVSAAVFSGLVVGGLLLIVTLLVRALAMPAEFYERDARGRAALARSKVKSAFGLKALLVFGVVLGAGVVVLVVALVSRPLEPRRPRTAEAGEAESQEEQRPADIAARQQAWLEAQERAAEEREAAQFGADPPPGQDPFGSPGPKAEAVESTEQETPQPAPGADPRAFPEMSFPRFGPRGRGPSEWMPERTFGPPTGAAPAASDDPGLAGGTGGQPFRAASPDGQPVIGFRHTLGSWAGQQAIGKLEPLFTRQSSPGTGEALLARDGYAVGAIEVDAGQFVHAVRVVFMRITPEGRLDPDDTYTSDWLGHPAGNTPKTLGGTGEKVIGVRGRGAAVLDAVGLVFEES